MIDVFEGTYGVNHFKLVQHEDHLDIIDMLIDGEKVCTYDAEPVIELDRNHIMDYTPPHIKELFDMETIVDDIFNVVCSWQW